MFGHSTTLCMKGLNCSAHIATNLTMQKICTLRVIIAQVETTAKLDWLGWLFEMI